jgi:hypothetical protein
MITAPVFLVGAERSGSTMLRLMLNDHPDVCWLNEFEYAVDHLGDDGAYPNLDSYSEWLSSHRTYTATGFVINRDLSYNQLVNNFLIQKKLVEGKPMVGATVHRHFERLLAIWPNAKFIHILRDPRDVARSVLNIGWVGNIYYGADRWLDAERKWDKLAEDISPDRYIEVKFEQLLNDPIGQLESAWELIGVDSAKYEMKYWKNSTYDPPNPGLAYQWKRKLKPYEIRLIESRIGRMLASKGYEDSGLPLIRLSKFKQSRIALINRFGRAMNRRKRYGTRIWIASIVVPRLPYKEWRQALRIKLNEIERRQLK